MLARPLCFQIALSLGLAAAAAVADPVAERAALVTGVNEIAAPGVPGAIAVTGPEAFAVVAGKSGEKLQSTVVGATHLGKGRVVAFAHGGYLNAAEELDTGKLLLNSVKWTSSASKSPKVAVRRQPKLLSYLRSHGILAEDASDDNWLKRLPTVEVVCVDAHALASNAETEALRQWVMAGGGLITAATGWGWAQIHPDQDLAAAFLGNRLLSPAGLTFTGGTSGRSGQHGISVAPLDLGLLNAGSALDRLLAVKSGQAKSASPQLAQASATVAEAMRSLPAEDSTLLPRLASLREGEMELPTPGKPLTPDQPIAKLLLLRDIQTLTKTRPEQIRQHPAAEAFPGAVRADAPRITKEVSVDTAVRDWHSTGLYASPGAQIEVKVPASAIGAGLSVRIGCHTDDLSNHDSWQRVPEISRTEKLTQTTNVAANPLGGLIYVIVPRNSAAGTVKVTISGAVQAPYFELGRTTLEEWKGTLRSAAGPWAELATAKIILSVPSSVVRTLDNPEAVLKFWDSVLDAEADLAGISHDRERPERITADVDISVGYMHSGYPIMTHLDVASRAVDVDQLRTGGWGFWHELGHNHQVSDWTFEGTTEVTCNLFSLYVCETVCGMSPGQGHEAMAPARVTERLANYVAAQAPFERWKGDPFLALTMYLQLRNAFGWEVYKKVFADYRKIPASERPKTDNQKRDLWLVRFSKAAGKNLGPFFQAWGVPTSDQARAEVASLPNWLPEDWPK